MEINAASLRSLNTSFNTAYNDGLSGAAASQWGRIATEVPSTTGENEYGWLGSFPRMREWLGDRQIQNLSTSGYRIKNRKFELTIGVARDNIEDDNIGIYAPMFRHMGESVGAEYDTSVWALLKAGFSTPCYDGQFFFDTDHPVLNEAGQEVSVVNTDGGAGTPWFLVDDRRVLKPLILQIRKRWKFISLDKETDPGVFMRDQYTYGVDGRYNVGFGFWQMAWGSKQTLDATNYANASAALGNMKGDYGRPLGIVPRLLIVPQTLASQAKKILLAENDAAGATNIHKGSAELLICPWL
ncbi:Mu-like prophage major head subunit gpT family protein [Xanthobacter sp. KR7-225]|uniref:Mu-like prophage major head subunit gpT family protein n=1 Tax=Xanthobacter sp. KR7-225 TaxID=3156613 RepID=UPI0032B536AB